MGHAGENGTNYISTAAARAAKTAELDCDMTPNQIADAIERLRLGGGVFCTIKVLDAATRDYLVAALRRK